MKNWQVAMHVNNHPGTEYISECGKYVIDESRKEIIFQQGMPVIAISFKGIPEGEGIEWKIKK
ncbi:hypothetical protein V7111_23480 [Neobacillus niacini]|uniref:hypothetical protein n=1 Tax=Neobacillus niacini TaxID=86668 RepID=UPI003002F950